MKVCKKVTHKNILTEWAKRMENHKESGRENILGDVFSGRRLRDMARLGKETKN